MRGYEEIIHCKALEILESVGLKVHDVGILRRLEAAGARVDMGALQVRFERTLVEEVLSCIPKDTTLYDWEGNAISGNGTRFMSSGTGVTVLDHKDNLRRPSSRRDVREMVYIQDKLQNLTVVNAVVSASEFQHHRVLVECYEVLCHSRKHAGLDGQSSVEVDAIVAMASRLKGGQDSLRAAPPFHMVMCPKSPLSFSKENANSALQAARYGMPVGVMSMSMGGGTAPVSLFGQVVLTCAEILGGFCLVQLLHPGTPMLASSVASVLDMRTAILSLGAPERPILGLAIADMARYYGVLSIIGGMSTDAKSLDLQNGFEKAITSIPLMGKVDFIFGAGGLDSAGTYSLEQLLIDHEFMGALLASNQTVDSSHVEAEVNLIKSMGFCGEYLCTDHTLNNFRQYWRPAFFERLNYGAWLNNPRSVSGAVRDQVLSILSQPIEPLVDSATLEDLTDIARETVGLEFSYDNLSAGIPR